MFSANEKVVFFNVRVSVEKMAPKSHLALDDDLLHRHMRFPDMNGERKKERERERKREKERERERERVRE